MKKLTRVLSLVGLSAISVGAVSALTSCDKREEIVVTASSEANPYVQKLIDEFADANPEFDEVYKVRLEIQGEGDAATTVITDVTSAADIYYFAQDQLARLITAGGLSAIPSGTILDDVTSRNDASSLQAASSGGTVYAYPATSDNGYFAYYDKTVPGLQDEFEREGGPRQTELIKICEKSNVRIAFNLSGSGWYLASYFIATGCESTWVTDTSGSFINYEDNWNTPEGLSAIQGAAELMTSTCYVSEEDASVTFNGNSGIQVSGTWDSEVVRKALGENMGVAPLWTFDIIGDGDNSVEEGETETFHLGSFSGNKLVGVKPQTDAERFSWCHQLANYITGAHGQMVLFEGLGWGPSNLVDQADSAVADDPVLSAFAAQNEYAVPQGQYPNDWWNITISLGAGIAALKGIDYTNEDLWGLLQDYANSVDSVIGKLTADFAVTGTLAGSSWSTGPLVGESPYALYEGNADSYNADSDGKFVSGKWTVTVELEGAGCYVTADGALVDGSEGDIELGLFRVCDYDAWTGNWGYNELTDKTGFYDWNSEELGGGSDNNIGAVPGTYTLVFDYTGSTPALTVTAKA